MLVKGRVGLCMLYLLACFFMGSSALRAQAVGEMVGTVTDPSGAVIPHAKVTAIRVETGISQSTVTTEAGTYTIPSLVVGTYTVTAEAQGFKTATATDITLDVSQQREVDFKLAVAGVTSAVEVNAAPPLLNTTSGALGGVVTGQQVQTLPLNGRSIVNLVMLQPGMNPEVDSTGWFTSEWASNGNRGQAEGASLDGVDASDYEMGNIQFANFNLDAIAEFRVLQNNYSAEYGQGAGSIVQLASKSGTNQFHGSAFEFVRNSIFDARSFFSNGPGSAGDVPPFRRNEFGGTFGGPLRKDKTFFFGQYAGFRQRLGTPNVMLVPTPEERQGTVTISSPSGQAETLQVPLDPVAQKILNSYPLPNQPGGIYNIQYSLPTTTNQFSVRGDHNFSAKDSMFLRASYVKNTTGGDPVARSENPSFGYNGFNDPRNYALTETHIFSPTLLNTFGFGLNREIQGQIPATQAFPQNVFTDGLLSNYGPDTFIFKYADTQWTPQDKLTWTRGRHTLDAGVQYRRVWANEGGVTSYGPNGVFFFSPGTPTKTAIPISGGGSLPVGTPSPSSLVSFMLGQPAFYNRGTGMPGFSPPGAPAPGGMRQWHLNLWLQDDIKATSRLTINLGLRYEYNSVPFEVGNRLSAIVDDPHFAGGQVFRRLILNPTPEYNEDRRGFGPRFGLAERVDSKTVVRGGFGIFTNVIPLVFPDQALANFPLAAFSSQSNPPFSATPLPTGSLPSVTSLSGQVLPPNGDTHKIPPNTPVDLTPIAQVLGPIEVNLTSVDFKNGYTMAGNVTIERELPGNVDFQLSYVANNAVGLYAGKWPNAYTGAERQYTPYTNLNPGLNEFQLADNHAHSTYNGMQAQLRKISPSHGLQFQAAYTYSKTIDNASTMWNGPVTDSAANQQNPFCWACEKSVSGFDFTHRFVMNFQYTLPSDRWQFLSGVPKRLTGGWQFLSIISAQSGFPFTVNSPFGTVQYGTDTYFGYQPTRPDVVQQPTLSTAGEPQFFSDAVVSDGVHLSQIYFATPGGPATGLQDRPGSLGRNTFRTHPFSNFDFSVLKDTRITEGKTLQFRAEFFNLFNQHAFGKPGAILGGGLFGVSTYTVLPERQIQFGLRLIF